MSKRWRWATVARDERGFTLIELLVVAAILAVMASLLAPKVLDALRDSKVKAAVADADSIRQAMERYLIDNNDYPSSIGNYGDLSNALGKYMNFPAESQASFTFGSYSKTQTGGYVMDIYAKDKSPTGTHIQIMPTGVGVLP